MATKLINQNQKIIELSNWLNDKPTGKLLKLLEELAKVANSQSTLTGLKLQMYHIYRMFFIPAQTAIRMARNFGEKYEKY